MSSTLPIFDANTFPAISRGQLSSLQVNLGYRCNQSCAHCHVNAGPHRKEMMDADTLALIPKVLAARKIGTLDLTGGAPELHPSFRDLVRQARTLGVHVIDRCNLSILLEEGQEDLPDFLAAQQVEVVASLPCYLPSNVDKQRGKGVFDKSIAALKKLNALGYGREGSDLKLNLVYNPLGPTLPPPQQTLEAAYKRELLQQYGIEFNHLLTITNMPIQRFGAVLAAQNQFDSYMRLLKQNYDPANLEGLMCRTLISVDWQGHLYDCDFNQQLGMPLSGRSGRQHLRDLLSEDVDGQPVWVAEHCYGCTAGQGSSCAGALLSVVKTTETKG